MPATRTPTRSNGTKTARIMPMTLAKMEVDIVGITPIITHRMSEDAIGDIADDQGGEIKARKKEPRNPVAEFEASKYYLPDGRCGFPAIGVKRAMVTAMGRFTEAVMTQKMGVFFIPADLLVIESDDPPTMRTDRVKIGQNLTTLRYRPMWSPWRMTVPFTYLPNHMSLDELINAVNLAGMTVGIGDWRIEKKGSFGQWEVENVRHFE